MSTRELVAFVKRELESRGDEERAAEMAAYMKTEMPFYGVPAPARKEVLNAVFQDFSVKTREECEAAIQALWKLPQREPKYLAVNIARRRTAMHTTASLPLIERMIREGAWWDFVDELASHVIGGMLRRQPEEMWPVLDRFIEDRDMWIRRAAILAQLKSKHATDFDKLAGYCEACMDETEFFIRKAIGWALREYAKREPKKVRAFVKKHDARLSGLSKREALKNL